jgi:hypothetical protein
MQPSNVSSGYWLQLPVEMGTAYRFPRTSDIELDCVDDCNNDDGWQYQVGTLWQLRTTQDHFKSIPFSHVFQS